MKTTTPGGPAPGLSRRPRTARERRLDFVDRLAARLISLGGVAIVFSVVAIVVFVGAGALPLLRGADARGTAILRPVGPSLPVLNLVDEYRERRAMLRADGLLITAELQPTEAIVATDTLSVGGMITAADTDIFEKLAALAHDSGFVSVFEITWRTEYTEDGRISLPVWRLQRKVRLFDPPDVVEAVVVARDDDGGEHIVARGVSGQLVLNTFDPEWEEETRSPLPQPVDSMAQARTMAISTDGRVLAVGRSDGRVVIYDIADPKHPQIDQIVTISDRAVTASSFLLGGISLVFGTESGRVERWLPVIPESGTSRRYQLIDTLDRHADVVTAFVPSRRDKSFLSLDRSGAWHLNHATSHRTYFKEPSAGAPVHILTLAPKADGVVALLDDGRSICWSLANPYPTATAGTLLGKVWYEGYSQPEFVWQSTGGTDEFEPKLSLVPLMFGTIKGTFYAMLFSIPIALLAAIYVSQLARPGFRTTVKPIIELMAAIPSVVVGFLAALWLAPVIERHLVATGMALLALPVVAVTSGAVWTALPRSWRDKVPEGLEPAFLVPVIVVGVWLSVVLAPGVERLLFDGNVRQWLFTEHGIRYDPRNNIVVGFALGIAVIPIIFTVSEDALSNVPTSLVSGALALGASRWQATWRIVLRAASPGIFAAIMLGFGRAVGETMIVLMATGNTPILDWSIFNGMRTMSATIAVEIPEAPVGGTLYRVIFLVAFLLFILTLLVNTVATAVGSRLRKRYGRF